MRLLSQLPIDFLRLVVLDFLEARDLARLCCADRSTSTIIQGHVLKDDCLYMSNEFMLWVEAKRLFVRSIILAKPLDESLLEGANCLTALQSIWIQNGFSTTELGLQSIFTKCTNLGCLKLSDPEEYLQGDVLKIIGMNCAKIRDLTLWSVQTISIDGLRFLVQGLLLLRKLSLGSVSGAAGESVLLLFCEHCVTLEIVNLSCCGYLTDVALNAIAHGFPHLKELRLRGNNCTFSTPAMCRMLQSLPTLTKFTFPFCTPNTLDPICIVHLSDACPNLRCVETGSIDVDDDAICSLARNCFYLEELSVYGSSLTDASISVLASHCPHIAKLTFGGCVLLTDVSLFAIAKGCPRLFSLRTNNCTALTDAGYIAIAQHCLQLTDIALSCGATDATIMQLAMHSASLNCVWCHSSSYFSDTALVMLVKGCEELALVDMNGCRGLTAAGVAVAQSINVDVSIRI